MMKTVIRTKTIVPDLNAHRQVAKSDSTPHCKKVQVNPKSGFLLAWKNVTPVFH